MAWTPDTDVQLFCYQSGENCHPNKQVDTDVDNDGEKDGYFAANMLADGDTVTGIDGTEYLVRAKNMLVVPAQKTDKTFCDGVTVATLSPAPISLSCTRDPAHKDHTVAVVPSVLTYKNGERLV